MVLASSGPDRRPTISSRPSLAKAEGNPALTTSKRSFPSLRESVRASSSRTVTPRFGTAQLKVPATIHDLIAARVDRLAEHLKATLQSRRAVFGRQFAVPVLWPACSGQTAILSAVLDDLYALESSSSRATPCRI